MNEQKGEFPNKDYSRLKGIRHVTQPKKVKHLAKKLRDWREETVSPPTNESR